MFFINFWCFFFVTIAFISCWLWLMTIVLYTSYVHDSEPYILVWDWIQWFLRIVWINRCIESWIVHLDSLGRVIFIVDSYVYVNFIFLNLMKLWYSAFHFVLWVHTWLWWNLSHHFHVVYLEINAKCCRNFVKSKKRKLTFMYESSIKNVFLNGIESYL